MTKGFAAKLPFLAIVLATAVAAYAMQGRLHFDTLAQHRDVLIAFRDQHYMQAAMVFMLAYIAIAALSLPGATLASLAGGFLFGIFPGALFNIAAATIGATAFFLAAKHGFGAGFAKRIAERGGAAARVQTALQDNEWSALMIMRLVPAVPFCVANLLPAFVGVKTHRFVITTFLGIIPAGLVITSIGAGLGDVFARGEKPDLSVLYSARILVPILALVALAALPIVIKTLRKKAR